MISPDVVVGEAVSLLGPFVNFGRSRARACCFEFASWAYSSTNFLSFGMFSW